MRAFVFSLDLFLSLLILIFTLFSFSFISIFVTTSIENFIAAESLAEDILLALSNLNASKIVKLPQFSSYSLLEYIVFQSLNGNNEPIISFVNPTIPIHYGYRLEYIDVFGDERVLFDSRSLPFRPEKLEKMQVVSSHIYFNYIDSGKRGNQSPYCYISCYSFPCQSICEDPKSIFSIGEISLGTLKLFIYR